MPAPSESVKALERGSNSTLTIAVVSAVLAIGGWVLAAGGSSPSYDAAPDGTFGTYLSPGAITLLTAVSGFCTLLCAAMWAAHMVLSSMADAEKARETAASEARAAAQQASA